MSFNPLKERGIPLDRQLRNWSELNVRPCETHGVHPYTRCRVIAMNGIEVEAIINSHQFARHTAYTRIKQTLAMVCRTEQQQQKAVNWLIPAARRLPAFEASGTAVRRRRFSVSKGSPAAKPPATALSAQTGSEEGRASQRGMRRP